MDILEVIAQEFVNVFVKVKFDSDHKPDWIHFEQQEVSEQRFASDNNLGILNKLCKGIME